MNRNFKFDLQRFAEPNLTKDTDGAYLISSVDDLNTLSAYVNAGNNCLGKTFKQTQDIFFDEVAEGESNFTAIGNFSAKFIGTYDGGNFKIYNLAINNPSGINQGLFGYVFQHGVIKDVHLVNASIHGKCSVGGIVGCNSYGTVTNCKMSYGSVSVVPSEEQLSDTHGVGGLVGHNEYGTVSGVTTGVTVIGYCRVGGLVGWNNGTVSGVSIDNSIIDNCVTGINNSIGGLVGDNYATVSGSSINNSVSNGGRWVGLNDGTFTPLYALTLPANGITATLSNDTPANQYAVKLCDGKTYYKSGAKFEITVNKAKAKADLHKPGDTLKANGTDLTAQNGKYYVTIDNANVSIGYDGFPKITGLGFDDATESYTIANKTQLEALATYINDGGKTAGKKFKLTADITNVDFHIGAKFHKFAGTLDGDGHKITVSYNTNKATCALFNYVDGATIKNLTVDGTITTSAKYAAGFAAHTYGTTTITDCVSSVTINSTISGDGTHGGFVGVVEDGSTTTISNSIFDGQFLGAATNKCGGFVGYNSGTLTINNSLFNPTEVNISTEGSSTFARNGVTNLTNGYYTQSFGSAQGTKIDTPYALTLPKGVTASGNGVYFMVGNVAYVKAGTTVTLSSLRDFSFEDSDGQVIADYTYTMPAKNTTLTTSSPIISAEIDGTKITLQFTVDEQGNGYYEISSVEDLKVLSAYVNSDSKHDCEGLTFKQTQDITFTEADGNFTAIGFSDYDFETHELITCSFNGTFDGRGYKIINLKINSSRADQGLFGFVGEYGTVQDVNLVNANISGNLYVGGLVGWNNGTVSGTITNSTVSGKWYVGGLVGYNYDGTVSGTVTDSEVSGDEDVGGLVGLNWGTVTEYYALILPAGIKYTCTNASDHEVTIGGKTYYKSGATFEITVTDAAKAKEGLYNPGDTLLANGVALTSNSVTMGEKNLRVRYAGYPIIDGLTFDSTNNIYTIATKDDLQTLANYVNNGGDTAGCTFKLTSDISGVDFHIGTNSNNFAATLDGNGKTITVNYNSTTENCALFNFVDGATIKNLTVDGSITTSAKYAAGIAAHVYGDTNITDCISSVTITSTITGDGTHGGFVGVVEGDSSTTISNSIFNGSLLGSATDSCGGFVGWNGGSLDINNSIFAPSADIEINSTGSKTFARNANFAPDHDTLTNGYYTKAFGDEQGTLIDTPYTLTLPEGVTASGDDVYFMVGNVAYVKAGATVTLTSSTTLKTGYTFPESVTVNEDKTITATLDTANHYVFDNGDGTYTLATSDNTTTYPELVQVYELTLPDNVTAQGSIVVTDGDKTYAAGNITLNAAEGYTLSNITVNGTSSGNTFTINSNTNITADVTAIVEEDNIFNAAGTGVTVNGKRGDFHANSTLYSITASQENSTLIANAKNNTVIIKGGGENILTGGTGNDTFKFSAGGGIVTDYGIGATKDGSGKATTANGVDIVKVDGKVTGIYFDCDGNTKKSATFTATIVYGDNNQVIVLKDIVKKPTKTGSSPIYQTNDIAAATLKIWDTSGSKQAVLSAAKLKKLFHDDSCDAFTGILKDKTNYLVDISKGNTPATNPFATQLTFTGGNKH